MLEDKLTPEQLKSVPTLTERISPKAKNTASSIMKLSREVQSFVPEINGSPASILGAIYKLMVKEHQMNLLVDEQKRKLSKAAEDKENRRFEQLISVLTKPSKVKTKLKKEEKKTETTTTTTKPVEKPKVEKKVEPPKVEKPKVEVPKKAPEKPKAEKLKKQKKEPETTTKVPEKAKEPSATPATKVTGKEVAVATASVGGALVGKQAIAESIASHESVASSGNLAKITGGNPYNAYNRGTKGNKIVSAVKPIDFSKMTIQEYFERSKLPSTDENRVFAAGKYQIIPETMAFLIKKNGMNPEKTLLTPDTQDALFDAIIKYKRPIVNDYLTGKTNDRDAALLALAQEFASVGVPYDMTVKGKKLKKGDSYYSGVGGNKARNSPDNLGKALDKDRTTTLQNLQTTTPVPSQSGQNVDSQSQQNANTKQDLKKQKIEGASESNTIIINQKKVGDTVVQEKVDDRSVYQKKMGK